MDIDKLKILYDAANCGSIKKAADKLNYTQSGLLYMINSAEHEAGITLLKRNHKGVSLTREGKELEPYVQKIIDANLLFEEMRDKLIGQSANTLRIGAYPTIANQWIPEVVKKLHISGFDRYQIYVGTQELVRWLDEGQIDIAIVEKGVAGNNQWVYMTNDQVYAAVPSDALIEGPTVTLEALEKYRVILPQYNPESSGIEMLTKWVENRDINHSITISSASGASLLRMVGKGLGVTFLSGLYQNECPNSVRMLPLDPPIMREIGIIYKPHVKLTRIMELFIDELKLFLNGQNINE